MSSGSDSETPLVGRATEEPLLVVRATTLRDEVRDELLAYSELSASPPASASPEPAPAPPTTSGRWSGLSWETVRSRYRELKAEFSRPNTPGIEWDAHGRETERWAAGVPTGISQCFEAGSSSADSAASAACAPRLRPTCKCVDCCE